MSVSCELDSFVDGMDCASCMGKVERFVAGLPGTAGVQTSFARQTLHLTLDQSRTPRATLEGKLRGLDYASRPLTASPSPAAQDAADPAGDAGNEPAPGTPEGERARPWYASAHGRLVLSSGLLLALAFSLSFLVPGLAAAG
ncbi:MAG: cation transporter, partial [Deinococcus sp.]